MPSRFVVRPFQPEDEQQADALWKLPVYRPEDQANVVAMYQRARQAQEAGDRWVPLPPRPLGDSPGTFVAFWVAEMRRRDGLNSIIGTIAVNPVAGELTFPTRVPEAVERRRRADVVILDRLRVADEAQRSGVGTRLCQTAAYWCRRHGYRRLVLNTTTAQIPALGLYRKIGFREAFHSFVGKYELVWFELDLTE